MSIIMLYNLNNDNISNGYNKIIKTYLLELYQSILCKIQIALD